MNLTKTEKALLLDTVSIRITAAKEMLSGLSAGKDSFFSSKLKNDLAALEALADKLQLPPEPTLEHLISLQHEQGLNDLDMCAQSLFSPSVGFSSIDSQKN
ncbi:hypothetical protein [Pseudoalteromonas phenolica]|uniref:hypothetical protein n=1 Tax=Pseudoalteromonas phenolica TaxID=161398 RepID=UPI00110BEE26|nr:hypothetical protein [Pseudoalteromonas phenolica]TMO53839.1 hypothetical protein CWC21_17305 [Pseudoalteromonas phenolica]